jgi:hypothetical protein
MFVPFFTVNFSIFVCGFGSQENNKTAENKINNRFFIVPGFDKLFHKNLNSNQK